MNKQIKGVMPALVTPLNSDGITVNVSALRKLIGYHKSLGADGFYIAGATGEGLVLSMDARKTLIDQAICEVGDDRLKIVHVADMNFENTKYLAKYAEAAGADVISAIPPIYFGYDQEDIYNYYKEIASQVKIPLMLYYTPAANTTLDTNLFLRLLEFDNVTSVKWTMKDYYKLIELITASENRMTVINGPDEMLLCGLSAGCAGGIGTTYNVMLPLYKKIYELYQAGDMMGALEVQKQADKVVGVLIKYQGIQATKVVLEAMGFEVGNATFPMKAYTPEQKKQIFKEVLAAGFTY
ncbi:MAG: dihydrodipicolinate synthase family protein [Clostridia bacterium]|nr:dihydrodipicolinate synthase family protein [Clostridia bacterium]